MKMRRVMLTRGRYRAARAAKKSFNLSNLKTRAYMASSLPQTQVDFKDISEGTRKIRALL